MECVQACGAVQESEGGRKWERQSSWKSGVFIAGRRSGWQMKLAPTPVTKPHTEQTYRQDESSDS